jgi:hypothetical protein
MDHLLDELDSQFVIVGCFDQKGNSINTKYVRNVSLEYDSTFDQNIEYVTVFFYNSRHPDSDYDDPLGH